VANTIILKRRSTTGAPTAGQLQQGELAINTLDEKLYSKNSSNAIFEITDHNNLTNYVANEHIDWTNATQNLVTTGTLSASGNTIINSKINGQTILTIGESSTLRGDAQDGVLRIYSENAGAINLASFANTGSNLQLTGNVNFQVNMGLDILAGEFYRQRNSANTAWVNHVVSTTPDLNTTFNGGSVDIVDWNISGLTGVVNLSNPLVMGDNDIRTPVLEDYGITHQTATVSANAVTVNCTLGNSVYIDMDPATAAVTLTLSNPPASGTYGEVNLLIQMGTPAYDITWPVSVVWMGGGAPSLTTTNDDYDLVHLFTVNGGTTWFGTYATSTATGGGNVSNTGTPLNDQIAVWTSSAVIEGTSGLTYNGTTLAVTGSITATGNVSSSGVTINGNSVERDSTTDGLRIYGGTAATGGNIEIYGGSHATQPNTIYYDAATHYFRDVDASPSYMTIGSTTTTINGNLDALNGVDVTNGITCGSTVAASVTDLSKHLALYSTTYGLCVTGSTLNLVANGSNTFSTTSTAITSKINHDFSAGIDVTGNITVTGTVDGIDVANLHPTGMYSSTVKRNMVQYNRFAAVQEMAGSSNWNEGVYGAFGNMTNGPSGMTYDPILVMGSASDVRSFLVVPRTASRGLAFKGSTGTAPPVHTAWHYTPWSTTATTVDWRTRFETNEVRGDTSQYVGIRSGVSGAGGMRVYNSAGTIQGYVYHNDAQDFGLLHSGGGWGVRLFAGGTAVGITPNCDFSNGIDVTGNITVTGTVDGVDIAALDGAVAKTADNETITGNWTLQCDTVGDFVVRRNGTTGAAGIGFRNDDATLKGYLGFSDTSEFVIWKGTDTSVLFKIDDTGAITQVGNITMGDSTLTTPKINDYSITSGSATISANAATLTYSTAQAWELDLEAATGNVTVTLSGGPPASTYGEMIVKVQQDTTAARTITWAGGTFEWPGGTAPTMTATADAIDIYHFSTWNGGTTWWGSVIQDCK